MATKRKSIAGSVASNGIRNPDTEERRKKKKKRRESDPGTSASNALGSSPKKSTSKPVSEVVLRCAPKDAVSPVVASFANLTIPTDLGELKFSMHGGVDGATKDQRVVMASGSRMDYWGTNFGAGDESNNLCRYLVGIESPESGEITLYEVGHAYALRQSVGGRNDDVEDRVNEDMSWKERRDQLVDQFGSKKKKAAIRSREANVIEADRVVGGGALSRVLAKAIKNDVEGGEADGAADAVEEARRRFLPPMRLEASTPEAVYAASDIAVEPVLEIMAKQIDARAEGLEGGLREWVDRFAQQPRERCPLYVSKRLAMLNGFSSAAARVRMLQLLFLRHMCIFCLAPNVLKGSFDEISRDLGIPESAVRHFLEKFAVCESRHHGTVKTYSRTKTLKNQLMVHTLCLALVLDGCRLEFEDLAEDLKLSAAETRALVRELGCSASNTTAQLKIPVVFPRSRRGRTKN